MKVPPPTFCPKCRLQRRYAWRNERALFRAVCGLCSKSMLSAYSPDANYEVYCHDCWWSDGWDAESFGKDIDFSRPFFLQMKELIDAIPKANLMNINGVNSEYSNGLYNARNTYLSYSVVVGEDVQYSKNIDNSRQIIDSLAISDSERLAYTIYSAGSYDLIYSHQVRSCMNSLFLFDCINSSYCFMSANLRNSKYVFRGEQCTKEEYEKRLQEIDLGSKTVWEALIEEFESMKLGAIHKYAYILKSANTTGDALTNMKNCRECFEAYDEEDSKCASRAFDNKNVYDINNLIHSESIYEYISLGSRSNKVAFSTMMAGASIDTQYCAWSNGNFLFGCFGLRNKKHCILNKQYSEEEYAELIPKIIAHMQQMPYEGNNGRVYRYGEFFPVEFSPYAYNESNAQEHFPLTEAEILAEGFPFRAPQRKSYTLTKKPEGLPDHIRDVSDDILKDIIGCAHASLGCVHQCTEAFRITTDELSAYRRLSIPLPRLCPNCRHYKRLEYRKPWELWHRQCMCAKGNHDHEGTCRNEFETPYSPNRPETVYCESCYQKEVI